MTKKSGQAAIFTSVEQMRGIEHELTDRNQKIVRLMFLTLSRPSEIISLDWNKNIRRSVLSIRMHKTNKYKEIEITPTIRDVLDSIPAKQQTGSSCLFPSPLASKKDSPVSYQSLYKDIVSCAELLDMERITPYSWRRTGATMLYKAAKADPTIDDEYQAVAQFTGHSNISNLIKYIDIDSTKVKRSLSCVLP